MSDSSGNGSQQFAPGNRGDCQDCEDAPATHVAVMTIGDFPVGPLYVCADCYPGGVDDGE